MACSGISQNLRLMADSDGNLLSGLECEGNVLEFCGALYCMYKNKWISWNANAHIHTYTHTHTQCWGEVLQKTGEIILKNAM